MKYSVVAFVLVAVLAAGSAQAAVGTPAKQWEEGRVYGINAWNNFGTVLDGASGSVLVGANGAGGGIYEVATTQTSGTAVVKGSVAPSDAGCPVIVGEHVYYAAGDLWVDDIQARSHTVRRVDLADFGNPSDFVYAYEYGIENNSGFLTSDGSYLYMGWRADGGTGQHRTRKLDVVNGTPIGGDPFSLEQLWSPGVHATDARGVTHITYDPVTQSIYTTAWDDTFWDTPFVGRHEVWHNPSDPTDQPTEVKLARPMDETWADVWTWPRATRAQRYGDYVFVSHNTAPGGAIRPGTVAVYEVLNEGQYGLDVANVQEFQLTTTGTLQDIAVHGNGTDPLGMWVIESRVIESVTNYFMQYYSLGAAPPTHNPGDVNGDLFVGGADLTAIIDNWGMSPADWADGDIEPFDAGDDFIGGADYTQVLNNWGNSYAPQTVPEPATLGLLLLGGWALLRRQK